MKSLQTEEMFRLTEVSEVSVFSKSQDFSVFNQ